MESDESGYLGHSRAGCFLIVNVMRLRSIVFVIPSPKVDTPYSMSFAKRLARGIQALGVEVHLFRVVKSANPWQFVNQGLTLRRFFRETRSQLVVAQFGSYTGLLTALFSPSPVVVTYRGSDLNPEPNTPRPVVWAQHAFSHVASLLADAIVCVSRELAGRLRVRRQLEVIPSPTDIESFAPADRSECRAALGWNLEGTMAIFIPGANPNLKGIDMARQVARELRVRKSAVELLIVERQLSAHEVMLNLNAADALLFLSRYEGSPNLVREACACNTPVVSTAVGDVKEVLDGVHPSKIVERDAKALADALESVTHLGVRSNGRERVSSYATSIISRRTLDFYERVAAVHSGRRER
jgi:teichuronic acid biosynthesis glycosyltransferase TuaC